MAGVQRQRLGKPGPGRRGPRGGRGPRLDTLLPGRRLAAAPARAGLGGRDCTHWTGAARYKERKKYMYNPTYGFASVRLC